VYHLGTCDLSCYCRHRSSQAAQAAAAAASQINAKLGLSATSPSSNGNAPPMNNFGPPGTQGPPGMGMVSTENFAVPDRMVGLSKSGYMD
jgi:hypothetical protein